jgi:hypothetical protein
VALPFDVRASEGFQTSWKKFSYEAASRYREFDEGVLAAVARLWKEGPGVGTKQGDARYAVPVSPHYELVYEWVTDRDERGNATCDHLDLLPIERTQ